jgi:hypothetical protein
MRTPAPYTAPSTPISKEGCGRLQPKTADVIATCMLQKTTTARRAGATSARWRPLERCTRRARTAAIEAFGTALPALAM